MATFMTRVELHGAKEQDYVNLHSHMAQEGFTTTIRADNGAVYQLPPAEYNLIANCTRADALAKAQRAAQKTHKKFAVIVAEYTCATWDGLSIVQQPVRTN
jgi:Ni,Fe-hydrogenase I small subunit